jgi:hypothetical protein
MPACTISRILDDGRPAMAGRKPSAGAAGVGLGWSMHRTSQVAPICSQRAPGRQAPRGPRRHGRAGHPARSMRTGPSAASEQMAATGPVDLPASTQADPRTRCSQAAPRARTTLLGRRTVCAARTSLRPSFRHEHLFRTGKPWCQLSPRRGWVTAPSGAARNRTGPPSGTSSYSGWASRRPNRHPRA